MHSFMKENASLIAAIALPILFAAFFFISKQISFKDVPPPAYDFILAQNVQYHDHFDIKVIDGQLSVTFTYPKLQNATDIQNIQEPEIYYVSAKTMMAEPIGFALPEDAQNPPLEKQGLRVSIPISRLQSLTLSPTPQSPDGYSLDNEYSYRDGNLMTEIFDAQHRDWNSMSLRNGSVRHEIKGVSMNASLQVFGWVIQPTSPDATR